MKASDSTKDSFATCVESAGIESSVGLSLDVDTWWNSTYEMLVRALKFRKAFDNLHLYDRNYKCLPSEEEWDHGEKIQDFLKPFSTITTCFSGVLPHSQCLFHASMEDRVVVEVVCNV